METLGPRRLDAGNGVSRQTMRHLLIVAAYLFVAVPSSALATEQLPDPVVVKVLRVIDGETITARVHVRLGSYRTRTVSLDGIDIPKLKGECAAERELAVKAKAFVERAIGGARVTLNTIRVEETAGRLLARVVLSDGTDLSDALINAGLGRSDEGETREGWCH